MSNKTALQYVASAIDDLLVAINNLSLPLENGERFEVGKEYIAVGAVPIPETGLDVFLDAGYIYTCTKSGHALDDYDDGPSFSGSFWSDSEGAHEEVEDDGYWIWEDVAKTFLRPIPTDDDENQDKEQSTLDKIKELISEEE